MRTKQGPLEELLDEVEDLCRVYVGKRAESEAWEDTCRRLERLDRLMRRVRRERPRKTPTAAARAAADGGSRSPWAIS